MREIKFRAWIKDAKEMEYEPKLHFRPTKFGVYLNGWFVDNNVFEITQYTELKDKNGKEIYEGDIVKDEFGDIWELYWNSWCWMLRRNGMDYTDLLASDDCYNGHHFVDGVLEVIGNIYENKDLLE